MKSGRRLVGIGIVVACSIAVIAGWGLMRGQADDSLSVQTAFQKLGRINFGVTRGPDYEKKLEEVGTYLEVVAGSEERRDYAGVVAVQVADKLAPVGEAEDFVLLRDKLIACHAHPHLVEPFARYALMTRLNEQWADRSPEEEFDDEDRELLKDHLSEICQHLSQYPEEDASFDLFLDMIEWIQRSQGEDVFFDHILDQDLPPAYSKFLHAKLALNEQVGEPFSVVLPPVGPADFDSGTLKGKWVVVVFLQASQYKNLAGVFQEIAVAKDNIEMVFSSPHLSQSKQYFGDKWILVDEGSADYTLDYGIADRPQALIIDPEGRLAANSLYPHEVAEFFGVSLEDIRD